MRVSAESRTRGKLRPAGPANETDRESDRSLVSQNSNAGTIDMTSRAAAANTLTARA